MNLLSEPWIPVRCRDGSTQWVNPAEIVRDDVIAFDAVRADFNGALAQFCIGLLQTTSPIDGPIAWRELLRAPPASETLLSWWQPYLEAFECDGAGVRFMQDRDLRADDGEPTDIGNLLIGAPGDSTVLKKRGLVR